MTRMQEKILVYWVSLTTSVGMFHLAASTQGIIKIKLPNVNNDLSEFLNELAKIGQTKNEQTPILEQTCQELTEYLAGERKNFDVALDLRFSGTEFHKKVWQHLRSIPYGKTESYQDVAIALENPNAVRAVGGANRANPISIMIPCHRVLGKNGKLVGYGGNDPAMLALKRQFLSLESSISSPKLLRFLRD